MGDWNGDGISDIGVWRSGRFYFDSDGSRSYRGSDRTFTFGIASDRPLVGDWNGDGSSEIGVWRNSYFYLDLNNGAANPALQQADSFDYPFSPASAWSTSGDFTQYYNSTYHPGDDQNTGSGGNTDWGAPLLAMGNGEVVFADYRTDAWGNIVMIAHTLPDGSTVWSQMAHCEQMFVQAGDRVSKGQYIGVVGAGANDK